jgi:branched-chain amino acid transport system permease protein
MLGSVLSASVLTALPELLRSFAENRMVVYSLVLVVVMIFKPTGLMGTYDFSLNGLLDKLIVKLRGGNGGGNTPVSGKEGRADE